MTRLGAAVAGVMLALPGLAHACPSCIATKGEDYQLAYLFTAVFLTFLPLLFVGGVLVWAWRRAEAGDVSPAPELLGSTEGAE